MRRALALAGMFLLTLAAAGCGGDDDPVDAATVDAAASLDGSAGGDAGGTIDGGNLADAGPGLDAIAADGGGSLGAIEITGNWAGAKPETAAFRVALFPCPFSMPPTYYSGDNSTLDLVTGDVYLLIEDLEPGEICLMAYIDMVLDGLVPIAGVDATTNTGLENESGAIPVQVVAGQTTPLVLTFAIQ